SRGSAESDGDANMTDPHARELAEYWQNLCQWRRSLLLHSRQRLTSNNATQGLGAQHSGDVFQIESRRTSFSQLRKNPGRTGRGQKSEYVGFISRANAEFADRVL